MDLSKFDTKSADEGVEMTVINPVDETPLLDEETQERVTITLLGSDSSLFKKEQFKANNERLNKTLGRGKNLKVSSEEMDNAALEILVKCTQSWKHLGESGKVLECTPANCRKVYTNYPWLREQVDEFVNDRTNFLGN